MAKFDLKEYIENNRQQAMIYGGVGAVVLILLVLGLFKVTGVIGGGPSEEEMAANAPATGFGSPSGSASGPPMPGMTPGGPVPSASPTPSGPPMPGGPAMPSGSMPTSGMPAPEPSTQPSAAPQSLEGGVQTLDGGSSLSGTTTASTPSKKAKKDAGPSMFASRIDPFAPHGMKSVAELKKLQAKYREEQRQAALLAQLAALPAAPSIWRTKAQVIETTPDATQSTEPPVVRRVAGLLYGDRVLGVLETDGKSSVVKPGDVLTSGADRVKVTRIDRDGIILKRLEAKKGQSATIRVPLKSAPEGSVTSTGMPGRMPYGPGAGGFRGGPPMPGMPRAGGPPLPEG